MFLTRVCQRQHRSPTIWSLERISRVWVWCTEGKIGESKHRRTAELCAASAICVSLVQNELLLIGNNLEFLAGKMSMTHRGADREWKDEKIQGSAWPVKIVHLWAECDGRFLVRDLMFNPPYASSFALEANCSEVPSKCSVSLAPLPSGGSDWHLPSLLPHGLDLVEKTANQYLRKDLGVIWCSY